MPVYANLYVRNMPGSNAIGTNIQKQDSAWHTNEHTRQCVMLVGASLATREVAQDKQEDMASIEKMSQQVAEYKQLVTSPERAVTTPLAAAMAALAQERLMVKLSAI